MRSAASMIVNLFFSRERGLFNLLLLTVFIAMLATGMVALILPIYARELGATGAHLGILFAGFSLSRSLTAPLVGYLSDRKGRRIFLLIGLAIYSLISVGYITATSYLHLIILRFLSGFGSGMILPMAEAKVGDIIPRSEEGKYMSILNLSIFAGWGVGPILGGLLRDAFGLNFVFVGMGVLMGLNLLMVASLYPSDNEKGNPIEAVRERLRWPLLELLDDRRLRGIIAFKLGTAWGRGSVMGFLPVFAASLNMSNSMAGTLFSSMILTSGFLQVPSGLLADRLNRIALVTLGSIISSLSLFLLPLSHTFPLLLAICILLGFSSGIYHPSMTAITIATGREIGMGSTVGLRSAAMSLGSIGGSMTAGIIMDQMGIGPIFAIGGIMGIVGLILFVMYMRS